MKNKECGWWKKGRGWCKKKMKGKRIKQRAGEERKVYVKKQVTMKELKGK